VLPVVSEWPEELLAEWWRDRSGTVLAAAEVILR
jgi:hypothetical protein